MEDNKSGRRHLKISSEFVSSDKITKTGRGKDYPRDDYQSHGASLREQLKEISGKSILKSDAEIVDKIIMQIITPHDASVREYAHSLSNAGVQIVSYPEEGSSSAIVSIRKRDLQLIDNKLKKIF